MAKKIKNNPDLVFACHKCEHEIYVDKDNVIDLLETDCPMCGEEPYNNWILKGTGNYDEEYGQD